MNQNELIQYTTIMDRKILKTGMLLLLFQIVSAFICWLLFREAFFFAVFIAQLPFFAFMLAKGNPIAK